MSSKDNKAHWSSKPTKREEEAKPAPAPAPKLPLPYKRVGDVQNAVNKCHMNPECLAKIGEQFGVKYDESDYLGFRKKLFAKARQVL